MRITIVNGFFLPVPPISGGSTEKSWYNLAREFTAHGHAVTMISRRWRNFPPHEVESDVTHLRLPGYDHSHRLWRNLLHDFLWSCRVHRALPRADIVVVNAVLLPVWLGRLKPSAGRVVLLTGRIPKGQYRHYRRIARVIAPSSFVRGRIIAENPSLAPVVRVCGYPLNWSLLNTAGSSRAPFLANTADPGLTIGYVGRIHEEKGLLLLADALKLLRPQSDLPPWRLLLCGPFNVARGGSGAAFRAKLVNRLSAAMRSDRYNLLDPEFNERVLAGIYRRMEIFCYPSLAAQGETFGVAVAEAMACGAVPVVSRLPVFNDLVRPEANGLVFDHTAADAPAQLAAALARLLRDAALREKLSATAQADSRRYDFPTYAEMLLADFAGLARPS